MKILFYLGHPAHFHLFKHAIAHFGNDAVVAIKSKDVLADLLVAHNVPFHSVETNVPFKSTGKFALGMRMLKRVNGLQQLIRSTKPQLLAGSPAELAITGKITGVPAYMFFEDDVEKVAPYGNITGPFAAKMVCPDVCSAGKWDHKKLGYKSYHELAYLHPDHFTPDYQKASNLFKDNTRNFIIRFVELGAFHDSGKKGITNEFAEKLITILKPHGAIHITSERALPEALEQYRIHIPPADMHHALFYSDMFIGDSQTMTAEAAVMGTPALRYNDFVGELGYLEDLEHRFGLTYGFKTGNETGLIAKAEELLANSKLKNEWELKKNELLKEKVNLAKWMIDLFESVRSGVPSVK